MLLILAAGVLEEAAFMALLRPRTGAAEKSAGLVGSSSGWELGPGCREAQSASSRSWEGSKPGAGMMP